MARSRPKAISGGGCPGRGSTAGQRTRRRRSARDRSDARSGKSRSKISGGRGFSRSHCRTRTKASRSAATPGKRDAERHAEQGAALPGRLRKVRPSRGRRRPASPGRSPPGRPVTTRSRLRRHAEKVDLPEQLRRGSASSRRTRARGQTPRARQRRRGSAPPTMARATSARSSGVIADVDDRLPVRPELPAHRSIGAKAAAKKEGVWRTGWDGSSSWWKANGAPTPRKVCDPQLVQRDELRHAGEGQPEADDRCQSRDAQRQAAPEPAEEAAPWPLPAGGKGGALTASRGRRIRRAAFSLTGLGKLKAADLTAPA